MENKTLENGVPLIEKKNEGIISTLLDLYKTNIINHSYLDVDP